MRVSAPRTNPGSSFSSRCSKPAALVLVAAREGHREQVREALERLAHRLGGRHPALDERLPTRPRAHPPARAVGGQSLEQLFALALLFGRLDLDLLAAHPDLDDERRARRRLRTARARCRGDGSRDGGWRL